jgi:ABC-type branched-subunit amino acid transport system ATPase component
MPVSRAGTSPASPAVEFGPDLVAHPPLALSCSGVSKHFGGVRAVQNVSMDFVPGLVTGIIGANGAGKSTLVDLLTGVQRCDEGTIALGDTDITRRSPSERVQAGIGRTFQGMRLFNGMSAEENVMACLPLVRDLGFLKSVLQRRRRVVAELRREAEEALGRTGASALARVPVDDLSYGDQKLVTVARVVASGARVVLLDEPFAGLDEGGVIRLSGIIRELASEGRTVAIIDHNVDAMVALVDRMYVMNFGEVIASGDPVSVMTDAAVRAAYIGSE